MAGKSEKWVFKVCRDCERQTANFVEILTNRKGVIVICRECWEKNYTKGAR